MREPEDDHRGAEGARRRSGASPACAPRGPARDHDPGEQRADRGCAAQDAEPDRARVEDLLANSGSSATAPPKSTANRSSEIAPSMHGRPADEADRRRGRRPSSAAAPSRSVQRLVRSSEHRDRAGDHEHGRGARRRARGGSRRAAAQRRAGDVPDLERDRAKRHRAREELGQGTSVGQGARARPPERVGHARSRPRARGTATASFAP